MNSKFDKKHDKIFNFIIEYNTALFLVIILSILLNIISIIFPLNVFDPISRTFG